MVASLKICQGLVSTRSFIATSRACKKAAFACLTTDVKKAGYLYLFPLQETMDDMAQSRVFEAKRYQPRIEALGILLCSTRNEPN